MNILIVDDRPVSLKLLRYVLEGEGHTVREAVDGVEALAVLDRDRGDVIISDILMPRMDGYRLCHEIRMCERLRDLPIIIYSSTYTSPADEKLARDVGADKYLKKPATVETLVAALHEVTRPHAVPRGRARQVTDVLKEYSEHLVAKLEEKNIELEQRIRLAALSANVGTALTRGSTLREMLQRCCEALVQHLDAAFARVWTYNAEEKILELKASAGLYTHLDGPHGRVPLGKYKIGLIAEERKPHLTNSVIGDARVSEQAWARREGLVAFAGYPLIIGDRLIGVMAMFARQPLSMATLEAMAVIADGVAVGAERLRADEELRATHAQLQQLLTHGPAVIYQLKIEGPRVVATFISDNLLRLWGVTVAEARSIDWWLGSVHPEDRDRMLTTLENGLKDGGYTAEYRFRHGDGTYRWVMDTNRVVREATGAPQQMVGAWTDITERKREEEERLVSERRLREMLENVELVAIMLDRNGLITFCNDYLLRLTGWERAEVIGADWFSRFLPETDQIVRKIFFDTVNTGEIPPHHENPIKTRSGQLREILWNNTMLRDASGHIIGTASIGEDITDRRRGEVALVKANLELVETSRQAGMAEMATGVLHNVGNVLTSVNVASSCLASSLKKSKVASLSKVVALLNEHEADLGVFLTSDPRGRAIPAYLAQLAELMAAERTVALEEMAQLQKNIEHLKQVVTIQQSCAKGAGKREMLQAAELVEDTLRMDSGGHLYCDVQVIKEFEQVPAVIVEKHQVLQILMNLVRNARQACHQSGGLEQRLTLRVTRADERVRIAVSDNGVGISPDHLTGIFARGFTTKKDGHGFGLHTSAAAARRMGGDLRVQSAGLGHGATFTLELPI